MGMGNSKDLLSLLDKKLSLTRRSFMKSVAAVSAAVGVTGSFGCSKSKSDGGGTYPILVTGLRRITAAAVV